MTQPCCPNQAFDRHPDPDVADIGQSAGIEFTIGHCRSCGAKLMHCWAAGGASSAAVVASEDLISQIVAIKDHKARRKFLSDWWSKAP